MDHYIPPVTGRTSAPRHNRGLTLVELMVAMAIGLVLTIIVAQIFLNSKATFASTDSLSRLQENGRYGMTLLSREIRMSSYKSDPQAVRTTLFPGTAPALVGADGGGSASDSFTVRFQGSGGGGATPDGTVQDCVGNLIDYNLMVTNTFFIQNDAANGNEPTLFCNTVTTVCVPPPAVGATCFPLVPGVENMQLLYGEDTTTIPDQAADRWVTAGNVSNWDNVVSVRVALLLRTPNGVNPFTDTKTYSMGGTNVTAPGTDTRMRRVYMSVVNLRNRAP